MRDKKHSEDENIKNVDETVLEKRVKEMMDPTVPDPIIESGTEPEIDIFQGTTNPTTAPEVDEKPAGPTAVITDGQAETKTPEAESTEAPLDVSSSDDLPDNIFVDETKTTAQNTEGESEKSSEADQSATDQAVDDIMVQESDELLEAEDKELAKAFSNEELSFKDKLKNFFSNWWHNKKARWATIVGLAALLIATVMIPPSRYFVLNSIGVRGSTSMTVLDESTGQPLKNVKVMLANQTALSDTEGKVTLQHLKLGTQELVVEKHAFAVFNRKLTVGWGSNPIGDITLQPVGSQYAFTVSDFLSGKPIEKS